MLSIKTFFQIEKKLILSKDIGPHVKPIFLRKSFKICIKIMLAYIHLHAKNLYLRAKLQKKV
jgi:hypothetical protein